MKKINAVQHKAGITKFQFLIASGPLKEIFKAEKLKKY